MTPVRMPELRLCRFRISLDSRPPHRHRVFNAQRRDGPTIPPERDDATEEVAVEASEPRTTPTPTERRAEARRARLQAGAQSWLERVHQLRDLVHDHLGPRRVLHRVPVRLAERRPDRRLDRLAGDLRLRAHGGRLDGRADLEVPDRGRALLVGVRPRRQGLELDDRLVQHRRPDRDRRLGRLRRGALPQRAARPLRPRHLRDQLRRLGAHPRRDLVPLRPDPDPLHRGQCLRRPVPGVD